MEGVRGERVCKGYLEGNCGNGSLHILTIVSLHKDIHLIKTERE